MRGLSLKKPLLLGEPIKENVSKGEPFIGGDCFWCDEPVWSSSVAYTTADTKTDTDIREIPVKAVHKLCLVEIVGVGAEVVRALQGKIAMGDVIK